MNAERWERIAQLYHDALSRDRAERAAFIDRATGLDHDLRREVASLLAEEDSRSLLDAPMLDSAAAVLDDEVTLPPGSRLNQYEIEQLLGSGGMGDVYRARDTKLARTVALKLLPHDVDADANRVDQFKREAHILASLNHSSIGAIFGLEEGALSLPNAEQGPVVHALVLELVDGPTLAERIAQRPIPTEDAVMIAAQIARAVHAAHQHGVVHRDLKPANIKLRADGVVKVLDFGLAKLVASPARSATDARADSPGPIVGTAPYISPEQVKGDEADTRSDVWAFGCVLYEMLTGKRAFGGETVRATLANVLQAEPDWAALPADTPDSIRTLLTRSLLKDRRRRIADMSIALYLLDDAAQPAPQSTSVRAGLRHWMQTATAAGVIAVIFIVAGFWYVQRKPPASPGTAVRFEIAVPNAFGQNAQSVAVSPDGRHVVYRVGGLDSELVLRALDDLTPRPIAGTARANRPFFSPDGRSVAFFGAGRLNKISAEGGAVVELCAIGAPQRGGAWGPDETIVFATADRQTGLMRVSAGGGKPEVLTTPDAGKGELDHWNPEFLPGRRAVLFTIVRGNPERFDVAVVDLETQRTKVLIEGGRQPAFASGHLVFASEDSLRAVAFDPVTLELRSSPVPVVERVATTGGLMQFAVSPSGTLLYAPPTDPPSAASQRSVVWVDRNGREESTGIPQRPIATARLAPDGRRIALDIGATGLEHAIWLWDMQRQSLTQLSSDAGDETQPVWTLDGERIIFRSERGGSPNIYWQRSDGSGPAEPLFPTARPQYPYSLSPDGTRLFIAQLSPATQADVGVMTLRNRQTELLIQTPFYEFGAEVSPDGRWLAYQSNESGQYEIYVRPLPDVDRGRWQISTNGGARPAWARNGRELYYIDAQHRLTAVSVDGAGATLVAGKPAAILPPNYVVNAPGTTFGREYDVAADGRFLMIKSHGTRDAQPAGSSLVVIHNWSEELRRVVPVR